MLVCVLAAVGDLVDDIVVRLDGPINVASDTAARVERRRGGSAANVAVMAVTLSGAARFLGQVGDDATGRTLCDELSGHGVDVTHVRIAGHTGSIVVLVDPAGERSFLTDAGDSRQLSDPSPEWIDGVDVLHVPLYSLAGGPIAGTSATLIEWAYQRGIAVSIDLSSVAVIDQLGATDVRARLDVLAPTVVFANADEARALGIDGAVAGAITIVKRGPGPARVLLPDGSASDVAAGARIEGDTTGAGDAFAAGVLCFEGWQRDPAAACGAGHAAARRLLSAR
jgi:sugar/nucleoside kinase (ribokinase family)